MMTVGEDVRPLDGGQVMNLMRWEPFRETEDFLRSLSTPMFGRWPQLPGDETGMKIEWSPAVDIAWSV